MKKTKIIRKMGIRTALATAFCLVLIISILAAITIPVIAALPSTVTFDLDSGIPSLSMSQSIPFSQTAGGVTAYFSSPSGSVFSVQSDSTTQYKLSKFLGKYLFDNGPFRDSVEITFDHYLIDLSFNFATIQYRGSSGDNPSNITLSAYDSISTTSLIGSEKARGTWPIGEDTHPQGILNFNSVTQFNKVKIELQYEDPRGAVDFLIDNIKITATEPINPTPTAPPITSSTSLTPSLIPTPVLTSSPLSPNTSSPSSTTTPSPLPTYDAQPFISNSPSLTPTSATFSDFSIIIILSIALVLIAASIFIAKKRRH